MMEVPSANPHSTAPSLINLIDLIDLIRRLLFPSKGTVYSSIRKFTLVSTAFFLFFLVKKFIKEESDKKTWRKALWAEALWAIAFCGPSCMYLGLL